MKLYSKNRFNKFYLHMFGYETQKPKSLIGYILGWIFLIITFPLYINMYLVSYKEKDMHMGFQMLMNLVLIFAITIIFGLISLFNFSFMTLLPYVIGSYYLTPISIIFLDNISKNVNMEWYDEKEDDEQFEKLED